MSEQDLKKKMQEWLSLKKEADALAKSFSDKRLPDKYLKHYDKKWDHGERHTYRKVREMGGTHEGASAAANKYNEYNRQNPHLTPVFGAKKVEKAKLSIPLGPNAGTISGIEIGHVGVGDKEKKKKTSTVSMVSAPVAAAPQATLGKIAPKQVNPKDPVMNIAKFPPKAQSDAQKQERAAKILNYLKNKAAKSELNKNHEDIVAGIKVPHQLKEHAASVPHDHPHREIAAKFVADVWRKDKEHGKRMSSRYLGEDPSPQHASTATRYATIKAEKAQVIPADNSDPMVINSRATFKNPKEINGPVVLNSYKSEGSQPSRILMAASNIIKALKAKKE